MAYYIENGGSSEHLSRSELVERIYQRWTKETAAIVGVPTISNEMIDYRDNMTMVCEYLAEVLRESKFEITIFTQGDSPILYARYRHPNPNAKRLLFYGHGDTVGNLDLWTEKDPHKLSEENGIHYGLGTIDNKGPAMATILSLCELAKQDMLEYSVDIVLEFGEENGSTDLIELIKACRPDLFAKLTENQENTEKENPFSGTELDQQDYFRCDGAFLIDMPSPKMDMPQLVTSHRGHARVKYSLNSSFVPESGLYSLHSMNGGPMIGASVPLAFLITSMFNEDYTIAIEGWNGTTRELTEEEVKSIKRLDIAKIQQLGLDDVSIDGSNFSYTILTGLGSALVLNFRCHGPLSSIPGQVELVITVRTGPNDETEKLIQSIDNHISNHMPRGLELSERELNLVFRSTLFQPTEEMVNRINTAFLNTMGVMPFTDWGGGTLPIGAYLNAIAHQNVLSLAIAPNYDPEVPLKRSVHEPHEGIHTEAVQNIIGVVLEFCGNDKYRTMTRHQNGAGHHGNSTHTAVCA